MCQLTLMNFSRLAQFVLHVGINTNYTSLGVVVGYDTFFVERVINVWNSLPPSVNFKSLATFRRSVRCVDFSNFLQYS